MKSKSNKKLISENVCITLLVIIFNLHSSKNQGMFTVNLMLFKKLSKLNFSKISD